MGRHSLDPEGPFRQPGAVGVEQRSAVGVQSPSDAPTSSVGLDWLPGWERESTEEVEAAPAAAQEKRRRPSVFQMLLGFIGELLITAGALIGLFILWQVWWTDIIADREQADRITGIEEQWGGKSPTKVGKPRTDPPPAVEHVKNVGDVEGIMYIPKFGSDYEHSIEYGTSLTKVLDKGAFGHYENTAYPGEVGNFSTAAHRQTYGAPMRDVDELKAGDPIIVGTKDAYLVYYVSASYGPTSDGTPYDNHHLPSALCFRQALDHPREVRPLGCTKRRNSAGNAKEVERSPACIRGFGAIFQDPPGSAFLKHWHLCWP